MADKTHNSHPQPSNTFGAANDSSAYNRVPTTSSFQLPIFPSKASTMSGINQAYGMDALPKTSSLRNLLSPPEAAPYESFAHQSPRSSMAKNSKPTSGFRAINATLPSPPVSPETRIVRPDESEAAVRDPILYPHREPSVQASSRQQSLFDDNDDVEAQKVVEAHMSARALRKKQFRDASPPVRDDYVLALEFKSQVAKLFNADQRKWAARERSYLAEDERIRKAYQRKALAKIAPAPSGMKGAAANKSTRTPKTPKPPRHARAQTEKPRRHRDSSEMPGGKTAIRQPPTNGTTREDKDFEALPDYSPPLSTLPQKSNSLKVDWKGAPIDLTRDPHRHLLHPDEVALAANLRLDCATYLTSKRRIFVSRIDCLARGKEFRKTDSQQACKIDVNKASKLWQAFDKVGWLDRKYFDQYVRRQ
ncbi:MAG: hypothetical protein M1818_002562 [Claussenomyces sp. TS43310]|nr:MAG: hypothetical protein M1818_002562 [Claussenomyces sp. TS43310]